MEATDMTEGVTRRLSYHEVAQLQAGQQLETEEVIKALKYPSVENFETALHLLQGSCDRRFNVIQETAKEQSAAVGEADLRRMKRQFSSLKNTFLHYVVKDEFIAALADGLPNGTEDIQLAQFEEEATRNVDLLRSLKAQNEAAQGDIAGVITQITSTLDTIRFNNATAASTVAQLQEELAAAHAAEANMPPLAEGEDEAACMAALEEEAAQARALEAQIAAHLAAASDLEAVLPREREETAVAAAELADLQQQRAMREGGRSAAAAGARFSGSAKWAEEASALLTSLGGLAIIHAAKDALELQLDTAYPTAPVGTTSASSAPEESESSERKTGTALSIPAGTPCLKGTHRLALTLDPASGGVSSAVLTPGDVDISDVVDAAGAGARGPDFVVREVRARLAGALHRRAMAAEAQARYPGLTVDAAGVGMVAPLRLPSGSAAHVHVVMAQSWPAGDDVAKVVGVTGAVESDKAEAAGKVVVRGGGPMAALEAAMKVLLAA